MLNRLGKIVVLGCGGYMGQLYTKALLEIGVNRNSIIGVDISSERLQSVAGKYPVLLYTTKLEEALQYNPEIALVVVNSVAHLRVIEQCYRAGIKKLFVEKPLVYNETELIKLERLEGLGSLYTSFLINFNGAVSSLFQFMKERNLIIIEARAVWGKNWCAINRPMGGDAEEEMPHPLALIFSAISLNQEIADINCFARLSNIPHVQPQFLEQAKSLDYGFPGVMNDSTTAYFAIKTKDRVVPVHLQSSFNMYEQIRRVEVDFIRQGNSGLPEFKACLEFDVNGKDRLRIKEALTDKEIVFQEFSGNKLAEQLSAVLRAFAGEITDPRLVGFNHSAWLVRLTQGVVRSST